MGCSSQICTYVALVFDLNAFLGVSAEMQPCGPNGPSTCKTTAANSLLQARYKIGTQSLIEDEADQDADSSKLTDGNLLKASNNVIENAPGVGGWGGSCTCKNGQVYQVGDNNDYCGSLACVRGSSGTCNEYYGSWSHRKVECADQAEIAAPTAAPTEAIANHAADSRSGCPGTLAAGSPIVSKTIYVPTDGRPVVITGHVIREYAGRADMYLKVDGSTKDETITYTGSKQWEDAQVFWMGTLTAGSHTISLTGSVANAFGCGSSWGDLDVAVFPTL